MVTGYFIRNNFRKLTIPSNFLQRKTTTGLQEFPICMVVVQKHLNVSKYAIFVTGDFNAHNSARSAWCSCDKTTNFGHELNSAFQAFGLHQMVTFPTLTSTSGNKSCLDLLAVNRPELIRAVDYAAPLGASDHLQVICSVAHPSLPQTHTPLADSHSPPHYNFRQVPPEVWKNINNDLAQLPWHSLSAYTDVNL